MANNIGKQDITDRTVIAFTLYGFGCCGRCGSKGEFVEGAPRSTFCGTSCGGTHTYAQQATSKEAIQRIQELQDDLPRAAQEAAPHISWWSHIIFTAVDSTAYKAADALNQGEWRAEWNQKLQEVGLRCQASGEAYGFGRSRVTYLVIRILVATTVQDEANK